VRVRAAGLLLVLLAAGGAGEVAAQNPAQEISQSQRRLQEIRRERQQLQREMQNLQSQVHDVTSQLTNIEAQVTTSSELLREMEFQVERTAELVDETARDLLGTQDLLAERRAVLDRRLRDIYKRGPLHNAEVLLSARSFSDLLNRYKYLYVIARRDRALLHEVTALQEQLRERDRLLKRTLADIQELQQEKALEYEQLAGLQRQRQRTLSTVQSRHVSVRTRDQQLARDERQIEQLIATLERRRREAERLAAERRAAAAREGTPAPAPTRTAGLATRDMGRLNWPVEGSVLYRFGRASGPGGTSVRWNGIGIGAAAGTPVRSVEAGTVVLAGPFEGYGPTVVLSHGSGYYSLYLHLRNVAVQMGDEVTRGALVGTVGGENTPHGPHLEFQIRAPGGQAVDPLTWLQRQGG
jgi:murein hydrolase activator